MNHDQVVIVGIAAGWAAGVGLLGLAVSWLIRRWSVRWQLTWVAIVSVVAVVAGVMATAHAMFLSDHDYGVVLLVSSVAGVVAVIGGLGVGVMIAHSSALVTAETRRFGESGEFVDRVTGPAELNRLSAELARTSDRLRISRAREQSLEGARRELVSWVSHDLRTPLAGLRAMAEALEDGMADDPARYHRQIRLDVDRMVRLVEDLFELSRLHAGLGTPVRESVLVGDLVSEALASADPVARARGVRLTGSAPDGAVVCADPVGVARVLGNLIANALRHTPADGVVSVDAEACEPGVCIRVTDECGGITEADLERVFDLAWRGTSARTPEAESGGGLGLAIVKGIVEAHGGTVEVANVKSGCCFVVRLPVA